MSFVASMRLARLKAPDDHEVAYCHTISRVVNREFVVGDEEREQFVEMMRCYEHFCGVRVLTYCVMSNHFQILLAVSLPPETPPGDEDLLARAKAVYSAQDFGTLRQRLPHWRKTGARPVNGMKWLCALRELREDAATTARAIPLKPK